MLSRRPYLIRALYEWLVDAGETPHVLVDATVDGSELPDGYVQDGRIVLNIGPSAVQALELGNEHIGFSARFGGTPRQVMFPPASVLAIYGRESGQGMMFGPDEDPDPNGNGPAPASDQDRSQPGKRPGKPSLKVIK